MKKIITISLILIGSILISINIVRSYFYPSAIFNNLKFMVGDFVPPTNIILSSDIIYSNSFEYKFSWHEAKDYQGASEPVYYRFAINGREYKADQNSINLSLVNYSEGEYLFKVRACDQLHNCSEWSNEQKLMIDRTVPDFNVFVNDFIVKETKFNDLIISGDSIQTDQYLLIGNSTSRNNLFNNYVKYTIINNPRFKIFIF